jgi:hypothetical protein
VHVGDQIKCREIRHNRRMFTNHTHVINKNLDQNLSGRSRDVPCGPTENRLTQYELISKAQ